MKGNKQSRRDAKQLLQSCQVDGALDEARVRHHRRNRRRGEGQQVRDVAREVRAELARHAAVAQQQPLVGAARDGGKGGGEDGGGDAAAVPASSFVSEAASGAAANSAAAMRRARPWRIRLLRNPRFSVGVHALLHGERRPAKPSYDFA